MRTVFGISLFAVIACSAPSSRHARFELSGESGRLTLSGTPLDPTYVGTYDNPRGIYYMKVTIGPRAKLVAVCRTELGLLTPCGDVPFFSRIETSPTGLRTVKAWDLHGTVVATYSCSDLDDDVCGTAEAEEETAVEECEWDDYNDEDGPEEGSSCSGAGCGSGSGSGSGSGCSGAGCGSGSGSGSGSGGGGGGGGGGDGTGTGTVTCTAPPSDCTKVEAWARDCFCRKVNESIRDHGINYTVDCAALDAPPDYKKGNGYGYDGPLACRADIINDCEHSVEHDVRQTGCSEVRDSLHNWSSSVDYQIRTRGYCGHSPLVLDLAGNGVTLTDLAGGVRFDLLATGAPVQCSWIAGDDAFLALDRDNSGTIESATELFGNATAARDFSDGFAALAELDADHNGRIDAADPMFGALRVWNDRNGDGIGTANELRTLAEAGVETLSVVAEQVTGRAAWDGRGNRIPLTSMFTRTDGSVAALVDAFLRYTPAVTPAAQPPVCRPGDGL